MAKNKTAKLILEDGTEFSGINFGAEKSVAGEVVFATGMVGYPEALTDPSFRGQILVLTFPLIGNYGVPKKESWESPKIQVSGLIVCNYLDTPSHHAMERTLGAWFKKEKIPLLEIKGTRELTQKLRSEGVSLGKIIINGKNVPFADPNTRNLVAEVSTKKILFFDDGTPSTSSGQKHTIVLLDCGAKKNIIRSMVSRGFKVAVSASRAVFVASCLVSSAFVVAALSASVAVFVAAALWPCAVLMQVCCAEEYLTGVAARATPDTNTKPETRKVTDNIFFIQYNLLLLLHHYITNK